MCGPCCWSVCWCVCGAAPAQATNDYTYGLPLMLTLITARWVG
eukprot:COSAG05_NODE_8090_length_737_cov_0.728840_2_plen_42_part_01